MNVSPSTVPMRGTQVPLRTPAVRIHPAPWSTVQVAVTLFAALLFTAAAWVVLNTPTYGELRFTIVALLGLLVLGCAASAVRSYQLDGNVLVIRRLFGATRIPLAGLREVSAGSRLVAGSLRLFGNGGFFSTTGLFWNRRLGRYRMFLNDTSRAVLLRMDDRRIVVGPAEPEAFARELRSLVVPTTRG